MFALRGFKTLSIFRSRKRKSDVDLELLNILKCEGSRNEKVNWIRHVR